MAAHTIIRSHRFSEILPRMPRFIPGKFRNLFPRVALFEFWRISENEFQRFSEIFRDFQRFSEIFRDFQRFSETFRDFQRFSEIFRDFQRLLGIAAKPFPEILWFAFVGEPSERVADYLGHSRLGLSGASFEVAHTPDRAEVCVSILVLSDQRPAHMSKHIVWSPLNLSSESVFSQRR